jgi:Flp pilus assembly protein CpaB
VRLLHRSHRLRWPHRLRVLLATRPLAYWSLTAIVAVGTGAVIHRATSDAAEARRQWGEARPTLVATRAVAPGELLDATNTQARAVPVALRPHDALDALPAEPLPAAAPLSTGEIVTTARVGRGGRSEAAALLLDGTRGVAIPLADGALPLRTGDVVDVVAPDLIVPTARVVRVGDASVIVAVSVDDAAAVARAVAEGQVTLVLAP